MRSKRFLFCCLAGAAFLTASQALGADSIGTVERVGVYAYGTIPTKSRTGLFHFDNVFFGEQLETVTKGSLKIKFIDDTDLLLGSESKLVIDNYVFDPAAGKEAAVIKMTVGTFRFITGKISKAAVKLQTPVANIGIRGTDVTIGVEESGKTTIAVTEGSVQVSPNDGSPSATVSAGQVASVSPDGSGVSSGLPSQSPNDPGVTDGPGGDGPGGGGDGGSGGSGSSDGGH